MSRMLTRITLNARTSGTVTYARKWPTYRVGSGNISGIPSVVTYSKQLTLKTSVPSPKRLVIISSVKK